MNEMKEADEEEEERDDVVNSYKELDHEAIMCNERFYPDSIHSKAEGKKCSPQLYIVGSIQDPNHYHKGVTLITERE
jgi:hypothetical protein